MYTNIYTYKCTKIGVSSGTVLFSANWKEGMDKVSLMPGGSGCGTLFLLTIPSFFLCLLTCQSSCAGRLLKKWTVISLTKMQTFMQLDFSPWRLKSTCVAERLWRAMESPVVTDIWCQQSNSVSQEHVLYSCLLWVYNSAILIVQLTI